HFIGHLQTNKVKDVVKYVKLIHSVDRLKLGQALHQQLIKENKVIDILVQIINNDETRHCFRLLKQIKMQIKEREIPRVDMDILSMGMSGDFRVAIEEGATIIRLGTNVFGQRYLPDGYYWNEHATHDD
ncbi:alanine racemase, partial [Paenibacillus sp. A3]